MTEQEMHAKIDDVTTELRRTKAFAEQTTAREDLDSDTRHLYQGEAECARWALTLLMHAGLIPHEDQQPAQPAQEAVHSTASSPRSGKGPRD